MKIELAPGQVWVPTKPGGRAKPRTIVWVGENPAVRWTEPHHVGWVNDPANPEFPETGHDSWMDMSSFKQWIKKNEAKLLP